MATINPVFLIVMDGVGAADSTFGNAVANANMPHLDWLKQNGIYRTLQAHGKAVGLPSDADMGNSEVGHNALGAGQVYEQGAQLVQNAIGNGSLFKGAVWGEAVSGIGDHALHFIGLLSDGNVHSHEQHLYAMMRQAKLSGVKKVFVHPLIDGRDVGEKSAEVYVERLAEIIKELNDNGFRAAVASGGGRMRVTMDRYDADWSMVERGWRAHVEGVADYRFPSLQAAISEFRNDPDLTDQNLPAFVIEENSKAVGAIEDGDRVVFFNFRGDRSIEISKAFTDDDFPYFERKKRPNVFYAGMMQYDGDLNIPKNYLVGPPAISGTMGEYLANEKIRQFACSETQKFGHMTYFWNGNKSGKFSDSTEEYLEIPSDNVDFSERPWMRADEITRASIQRIETQAFDFGRINFANGDMVGHTGNYDAAIVAVETVDLMLGRIIKACRKNGTTLVVTADHGNADEMFDAKEAEHSNWQFLGNRPRPKTSHTLNQVPLAILAPTSKTKIRWKNAQEQVGLGNVAATCLTLMGKEVPPNMLPSLV